jgi:hypothetical protein
VVSQHDFAELNWDRRAHGGAGRHERVELASFTARVDALRQVSEESRIERTSSKRARELLSVDADEVSDKAGLDELRSESSCVQTPERKQRFVSGFLHESLAVLSNVSKVKIAERNSMNLGILGLQSPQRVEKSGFVFLIRALGFELDPQERKSHGSSLSFEQRASNAVDANAVVLGSDAREKRDDFVTRVGSKCGERQIAVFTATPAEYDRFSRLRMQLHYPVIRQFEVSFPCRPILLHLTFPDYGISVVRESARESLREARCVSPPLQGIVAQGDIVLS